MEKDISEENRNVFNFEDMLCRALRFEKEKGRPPTKIYVDASRQTEYVTYERFKEMLKRYHDFIQKNNRLPRFVTINPSVPGLTPASCCDTGFFQIDYQDTGYSCGASSLKMALSALGIQATEQEIMRVAGTTTLGTSHDGMIRAANHFGVKAGFRNFKDTSWESICDHIKSGGEVILHVMTHPLQDDCFGNRVWRGSYGHYIYLTKICPSEKRVWVADPSKGLRCHTYEQMEGAMAAVTWAPSVLSLWKAPPRMKRSLLRAESLVISALAKEGPNGVIGEQGITKDMIEDYIEILGLDRELATTLELIAARGRVKSDFFNYERTAGHLGIVQVGDYVIIDPEVVIARLEEVKAWR